MKKFNWITVLVLSVVTCGIYGLYAWYVMATSHNTLAEKYSKKKIMGFIPAILIGCVTCGIWLIVWYYQYCKQVAEIAKEKGAKLPLTEEPILMLILMCVPVISIYVLVEDHNVVVEGE